jgi:hypothetical protein
MIAMTAVIAGICIARSVTAVTAVPAVTSVTRLAPVVCTVGHGQLLAP